MCCRYAKPWKDLSTGDSYCLFFPFSPEHLEHTVPKLEDTRQDISILIHAKLREANDVSGSASALFVGGFSILEMDKVESFRTSYILGSQLIETSKCYLVKAMLLQNL